jgi:hypothetical protein
MVRAWCNFLCFFCVSSVSQYDLKFRSFALLPRLPCFFLSLRIDKATCERNSVCSCFSPSVTVDLSAQVSCQNNSTCGGAQRENLCVRSCCCDAASKGKISISIMSPRCIHCDWKLALMNAPLLWEFGLEFACWRPKHVSDSFLRFFFSPFNLSAFDRFF